MIKFFTLVLVCILLSPALQAHTWTGASSSNWFTAGNWSPATVPTSTSSVDIPGSLSTYPTLTANVTVAGLSMSSGAALHLAGYTFTDNGNVALSSATIDGGGAFNVVGAGGVSIVACTLTTAVSVTGYTGASTIYNNTITGNTVIADASTQNSFFNNIDGNLFTGNLSVTHNSATDEMSDGYGSGLTVGNHVTGNAVFTLAGAGGYQSAYSHPLIVDGNLTYNRTSSAGYTFISAANAANVEVGGTLSVSSASTGGFTMMRVKNATAGGSVSVSNASNINVQRDTLKATVSLTSYTGSANIYDNSFTGTVTISDAATQNSGTNWIDGNLITGNLALTHASTTDEMAEGYGSPTANGNRITGNALFTISGSGQFHSAYSHTLTVDGNLTINRTSATGNSIIGGQSAARINIGGALSVSSTSTGAFSLRNVTNGLAGGTVSIANASSLNLRYDTLKAIVNLTAYTGQATIFDNSFTGAVTISDASSQNNSLNWIDGNRIVGNLNLTHASTSAEMTEGYGSPSGNANHITGNATFTITGAGQFQAAYTHPFTIVGNLTINRSSSAGNTYINAPNVATAVVSGTLSGNIAASGTFTMNRVKNNTAGGTFSISNATNVAVQRDTLLANLAINGYTAALSVLDNNISGNTLIADAASQANSINEIDGNRFNGAFTLVHNSTTSPVYDGYGSFSGNGNVVIGKDSIVNKSGAAAVIVSYTHTHEAQGDFVLNSASGVTFNSIRFGGSTFSTAQQVGVQPISIANLYIDKINSHFIGLSSTVSVTNTLYFINGQIVASPAPLVFADGATHTGASSGVPPFGGKFIAGKVYKAGNQAFTFPIGFISGYNPISISAPTSVTDTFSAQYIPSGPHPTYDSSLHDASIDHISKKDYWLLNRVSGSANVYVTLGYNQFNSGIVNDMSKLTVAHWYNNGTSTAWHDEGNGATTGTNAAGTVKSNNLVSSFSPFALASTTTANPLGTPATALPLHLLSFTAQTAGLSAELEWQAAGEEGIVRYEAERSPDGILYSVLGNVPPENKAAENYYQFFDRTPYAGANYYRLAAVQKDGRRTLSAVRKLEFGQINDGISLYPNPAADVLYLDGINGWSGAALTIRNSNGQLLHRSLLTGAERAKILVGSWPAGLYSLEITEGAHSIQRSFIRK